MRIPNRTIASVVGYVSIGGRPFKTRHLGVVFAPAREDGYYLAMSTAGGDYPSQCVGGAATIDLAAEQVRARWRYPGESICQVDGQYIRR